MIFRTGLSLGIAAIVLLTGCQSGEDRETGGISGDELFEAGEGLDPAMVIALDEGTAAYQEGDYEAALRHYETAAEIDESVAAAWLGIYMAHRALGNPEAADSAMVRARSLAPGASVEQPDAPAP